MTFLCLTEFRRGEDAEAIYIDSDTRIQILDSMAYLPRADKEQCGAFIVRLFLIRILFDPDNFIYFLA